MLLWYNSHLELFFFCSNIVESAQIQRTEWGNSRGVIMRDRKRDYELLFIVSPMRSSEEEISATIERVSQQIAAVGGSANAVSQTSPWGRRKFAYPMREYAEGESSRRVFTEGFYVLITCTLPTLQIRELERTLKLNDAVLRYMLTQVEVNAAPAEAPSTEA
jgi:small subunit ribosomal protein S6